MIKQLYLEAGWEDHNGVWEEDRYIIVDENNMDLYGEHFTEEEANELIGEDYV